MHMTPDPAPLRTRVTLGAVRHPTRYSAMDLHPDQPPLHHRVHPTALYVMTSDPKDKCLASSQTLAIAQKSTTPCANLVPTPAQCHTASYQPLHPLTPPKT